MKERIVESIREEFLTFGIPQAYVEDYICNNSYEFVFVKAKPSFPSQNVSEFAESLQERLKIEKREKNGMVFEDIFSMGFNRTNRKFGYCREYRDVEMATYHIPLFLFVVLTIIAVIWENVYTRMAINKPLSDWRVIQR